MSDQPRLLFYFMHLLGVGHVYRAKRLIEGFARHGIGVDVVYGGEAIGETFQADHVEYLPPVKAADATYSNYLDEDGKPLTGTYLARREEQLLDYFGTLQPDMILIEAFPFGRRMVRKELGALLDAADARAARPLVVSSVRDILQERKKPGRNEETRDLVRDRFDHVLVHSDPEIIRLNETFPLAEAIADKITYTGFVVPEAASAPIDPVARYDVIVTAGGGGFGSELLASALEVAKTRPQENWCLATGPHMEARDRQLLMQQAPPHVTIVERLDNLAAHLMQAKLSISQCGYNTAMDVIRAHEESACRAVFVPYDTQGQSEQLRRAQLLHKAGFAINLPQSELTPDHLNGAMARAQKLEKVTHQTNIDGIENTASIVRHWLDDRRGAA